MPTYRLLTLDVAMQNIEIDMGPKRKGGISLTLSALWWVIDGLYKDAFFAWAKPLMPDWLLHPPAWSIVKGLISFVPPVILAVIGIYFIFLHGDKLDRPLNHLQRHLGGSKRMMLWIALTCGILITGVSAFALWWSAGSSRQSTSILRDPMTKNVAEPIEWRFDKPVTILFAAPRNSGEAVWIDGLQIHGTNKTDKPLKNVTAVIIPDMTDQKMQMRVNPHGVILKPEETATLIPPRADFDLMVAIPSSGRTRLQGLPADEFLRTYGGLKFEFAYDNGQNFSEYFSLEYIEDQLDHIERQTRQPRAGSVPAKLYGPQKSGPAR